MDGTLTVAVHDFDAIRRRLDIPPGASILEFIAALPPAEARQRTAELDAIEGEFAQLATPQPGARALLEALLERGNRIAVLTRNSKALAHETLEGAGLADLFETGVVLGRESAAPKPAPDGIQAILATWSADAGDACMMGDFIYDLEAGQNAGVAAIYFDPNDENKWTAHCDLRVAHHQTLLTLLHESGVAPI
ncbi:MAG: HAD family hydrolase [Chromatiales bacterium]|jgi:phosphoglycolate phosphatase-like HAD superfamily hydrolase|nr:HAD family hydrolase [Chromatiales bacterium]